MRKVGCRYMDYEVEVEPIRRRKSLHRLRCVLQELIALCLSQQGLKPFQLYVNFSSLEIT